MSAITDLIVDVGNSRWKLALFRSGRLVDHAVVAGMDPGVIARLCGAHAIRAIGLGRVGKLAEEEISALRKFGPVFVLPGHDQLPIRTTYKTMGTLGVDRLANAIAALRSFPGCTCLAIDIGTCITYDLIDVEGTYVGGGISPGPELRAKAMHAYSADLPMVDVTDDVPLTGSDTIGSLASGVFHGTRAELFGMIAAYRQQYGDPRVILTGGGALPYVRALKSGIFADPFLTLRGLHALLLAQLEVDSPADRGPSLGADGTGLE